MRAPRKCFYDFSHLAEIQLDRRRTTQDLYRNLESVLFIVDLLHDSGEIVERPICYANDLTGLEQYLRPRLVDAFLDALQM